MRKFQWIAWSLWLAAITLPAHASEGEVVHHLALFEIAGDGVHDDLARQLGSALREAVSKTPGHSLTDARVSLEQLSLVHDCDPEQLVCLGKIAKQLGVEGFIFGQLESEGNGAYAKLKLFDAPTQTIKRSAQVMFALRDASEGDIQRKADGLVAQLVGNAPASFEAVAAQPAGVNTATDESPGISGKRVAGYALLGGAALSVGLSVLAFVSIEQAESNENLEHYRRAVGKMDPNVEDACDEASENHAHGLGSDAFADVKDQCSTGRTFEVLQYVFLGAAAVSGGLGAYFLLSDDGSRERRTQSLLDNLPVRPIIRSTNSAELRAKLKF